MLSNKLSEKMFEILSILEGKKGCKVLTIGLCHGFSLISFLGSDFTVKLPHLLTL